MLPTGTVIVTKEGVSLTTVRDLRGPGDLPGTMDYGRGGDARHPLLFLRGDDGGPHPWVWKRDPEGDFFRAQGTSHRSVVQALYEAQKAMTQARH